ncbi:MAG TPA: phosphoribulokinase [Actinomycetota bacterium]|nr:phosphoribulokinase [Actinomycetota bacterium]
MDDPTIAPPSHASSPPRPGAGGRVASSVSTGLRPVLLGLAGDSASGKSTLSRGLEYVLGVERVGRVCTDDYHRYDRATRTAIGVTPLAPEANRIDVMAEHLHRLAAGDPVTKPTYDHLTGGFGPDETIEPSEIVIVEGLLPLADRAVRDAIDVAVFLDPDEELRRRWKLERDVFERGYSPRDVVAELERRERDADRHVRPQRDVADVIVRFFRRGGADRRGRAGRRGSRADGDRDARLSAMVTVRPTLPYPALREVLGRFRARGVEPVRWSTRTDRRGPMSVLEIDGDCPADLGSELEEALWSSMRPDDRLQRDRIGVIRKPGQPEIRSEALALAQLLIVAHLVGAFDGAFEL